VVSFLIEMLAPPPPPAFLQLDGLTLSGFDGWKGLVWTAVQLV
jgi:hypothetical protein